MSGATPSPASCGSSSCPTCPTTPTIPGGFELEHLRPQDDTLEAIREELSQRRLVGTRVIVEPPLYQGVRIGGRVRAWRTANVEVVEREANAALYRYLHPIVGGPAGTGWPFGRPLTTGEIHAVLGRVSGVDLVDDVSIFGVDLATNQLAAQPSNRLEIPPEALLFSTQHQIRAVAGQ